MRTTILNAMQQGLEQNDQVLGFWEAGSRAMGTADHLSDLDLQILVKDGAVAAVAEQLEAVFEGLGGVERRFQVPMPSWHGHWQTFYQLKGIDPLLLVDLCILEESKPGRFLEPEIHGTPVFFIDRAGLAAQAQTDAAPFAERLRSRLGSLEDVPELMYRFVAKELQRERPVDALQYYQGLLMGRLVEALRMRYCPWRYNFGYRYLQRDLPPDAYQAVQELVFVAGPEELPGKVERAMALLRSTVAALKRLDLAAHLEAARGRDRVE